MLKSFKNILFNFNILSEKKRVLRFILLWILNGFCFINFCLFFLGILDFFLSKTRTNHTTFSIKTYHPIGSLL